jgi:predicted metal-dependent hydrolase
VQLRLPWSDAGLDRSDAVQFVRHRRARRYILRVLRDGTLRVTLPRWGIKREAQAFVAANRAWIERQRALRILRNSAHVSNSRGRTLVDGREAVIELDRTTNRIRVVCDDVPVASLPNGYGDIHAIVERWLTDRARRELPPMLLALAATHQIPVTRVSIRNQRSRWGACTPGGTITLNWRLIQTPPYVRDYVMLHELMHRRELNHSRRFWRLVAACCPRHAEARHWLRKEGMSLWSDREQS